MKCKSFNRNLFFLMWLTALVVLIPNIVFSQVKIKGKIIHKKDATPAAYASVSLLNQKGGSLSDNSGNFSFYISKLKKDDTLLISSVGYQSLKMPVTAALTRSEFELKEDSKNLEAVTVRSFTTQEVRGSSSEITGYFRSWNYKRTGGEIGRIFKLPHTAYKIDKIKFKVNNRCDTCQIRLHIRKVANDYPDEELLYDSITVSIQSLTMEDNMPEFDLRPYDLTFDQSELFISMEVLNCKKPGKEDCSFCFAGSEQGEYIYKSKSTTDWETTDDYTIYLKLFMRY